MESSSPITKNQWKHLDKPSKFASLGLETLFLDEDAEKIILGLKPKDMDDKWFIYADNGWVYFHRSWTGALIYWLKLEGSPAGVRVTESYVNRQSDQYKCDDIAHDQQLCEFIINRLLLNQDFKFPNKSESAISQSVYQHHLTGINSQTQIAKKSWFRKLFNKGK